MTAVYRIAMAAGRDAGNRSMRAAGRTAWNETDWNIAADTARRVLAALGG
jgi:hypothetical protein